MRQSATTTLLTTLLAYGVVGPAVAHHSYASYDRCQAVTIEGTIESVMWANPHAILMIRSSASSLFRIEWFPLQQLQRAGVPIGALNAGDYVIVSGSKKRDSESNVLSLLTEIRRPLDGWHWSRNSPGSPPAPCTG
jgi:hypothetical protein